MLSCWKKTFPRLKDRSQQLALKMRNATLAVLIINHANKKCSYRLPNGFSYYQTRGKARMTISNASLLGASKYWYVHHDAARKIGTRLKRQRGASPVFSFAVGYTTPAVRLYAAVSGIAAIRVAVKTVRAAVDVFALPCGYFSCWKQAHFPTQGPWSGCTILQGLSHNISIVSGITEERPLRCCMAFGTSLLNPSIPHLYNCY